MEITVHFESQLRQVAGVSQGTVSVPEVCCVTDALQLIAKHFGPLLGERIMTPDGTLQRSVLLFVNNLAIAQDLAANHQLQPGDVLLLYPPISGG